MNTIFRFALASAALFPAMPALAQVTVGSNDDSNCYPLSCFASDTGTTYQQIYAGSAFSGLTPINQISFFLQDAGLMDSASYSIDFYLSSAAPGGLAASLAANRGSLLTNFGTFAVGGAMPLELSFNGAAFNYDPMLGNLLMEVNVLSLTTSAGYDSFFQADYTGVETTRNYVNSFNPGGSGDEVGALRTRFSFVSSGVPEPATWAMMLLGFAAVGASMRRKQAARVKFAF